MFNSTYCVQGIICPSTCGVNVATGNWGKSCNCCRERSWTMQIMRQILSFQWIQLTQQTTNDTTTCRWYNYNVGQVRCARKVVEWRNGLQFAILFCWCIWSLRVFWSRWRATLDFRPRKHSNPILDIYRASTTFWFGLRLLVLSNHCCYISSNVDFN
jgi:hypothetical protein